MAIKFSGYFKARRFCCDSFLIFDLCILGTVSIGLRQCTIQNNDWDLMIDNLTL